jgi:hypothetical protein
MAILEPVGENIWLAEGGVVSFYGFPYPTRSVIVQLANHDLWVWSPTKLSPELIDAVDGLGPVAHLVSPNKIHHLFLRDWLAQYPAARLWGPATTIKKRSDLAFQDALTDDPPAAWSADLDQAWFRGSVFMDEIVFLHRASRTVILADLIENFSDAFLKQHWGWFARKIARLDGLTWHDPGAPREWRVSFRNKALARRARDKVLSWNAEQVIMAHGDWQRSNGRAFMERSFRWLG